MMVAGKQAGVFADEFGDAILRPCALLFIDLLGVSQMATGDDADAHLVELSRFLRKPVGDFLSPESPWLAAFFSDTLVILDPFSERVDPEVTLMGLALQAAWVQVNLAMAGFFLRGALTVGKAHLENDLLFGPALVEAYELERRSAVHPRIVLSEKAVGLLKFTTSARGPDEGGYLRVEQDGSVFIDYLDILVDDAEDPVPALESHRDMVRAKLVEFRVDGRLWDKYRWVAEYHDSYCRSELPRLPELLIGSGDKRQFARLVVQQGSVE
jgi:hypothetical protein